MFGGIKSNTLRIAFTYTGALIGAGFASGQEIFKFFAVYEYWGLLGTIAAGVLFAVIGNIVIKTSAFYGMDNYKQYVTFLFGSHRAMIVDAVISLFLFVGLIVMLIASGTLWSNFNNCPLWLGFVLTAVLISFILLTGVQGLLRINTILVPILLVVILTVIIINRYFLTPNFHNLTLYQPKLLGGSWILSSLIYVSYNLVLGTVILSSLGKTAKRGGTGGAALGGLILGLVLALSCNVLNYQGGLVIDKNMPLLELAGNIGPTAKKIYVLILWIAILTTALGNAYGLLVRIIDLVKVSRYVAVIMLFIPSLFFLRFPFVKAIEIIYPLLGYLGLVLIGAIIIKSLISST